MNKRESKSQLKSESWLDLWFKKQQKKKEEAQNSDKPISNLQQNVLS